MRQLIAGLGVTRNLDCDFAIDLGHHHPSAHGGFQLALTVDGDTIVAAEPRVGFLHRSAEKLFEARDYRQILMLANRHDWLSAFSSELTVALAVEEATGITSPERATWLRMILAEANRIAAHLLMLAFIDPGLLALREDWARWQERATGGRVHPMITRIGGLVSDIPALTLTEARELAGRSRDAVALVSVTDRWDSLAIVTTDAANAGASGPVGWASGVTDDLRRHEPYLAYRGIHIPVVLGQGSAADRYRMLIAQIHVSSEVIATCVQACADSAGAPVNVPLPKTLRVPEGITYVATENPFGHHGVLLVSSGDKVPWRMKLRTPSFAHVQLLSHALPGTTLNDLGDAVASFFLISGDIDR